MHDALALVGAVGWVKGGDQYTFMACCAVPGAALRGSSAAQVIPQMLTDTKLNPTSFAPQ